MRHDTQDWQVAGRTVRVTHLEKPYWPGGYTKGAMLEYYRSVAPVMLPAMRGRPVTLRVFPGGAQGPSYYQRERPDRAPAWMRDIAYRPATTGHVIQLPLIDDAAGLLWLANMGSIEFHLWGSRLPDLTTPDVAIFDLDPGDELAFADVLRAGLRLRDALERQGARSYPKTSGSRGLHVYVPLPGPRQTFEAVRAWANTVADGLAETHPDLFAPAHGSGPTHEGTRITIDAAQNSLGRNTAAPYTLRAREDGPTVSTPLTWQEVEAGGITPADFGPDAVLERVRHLGDLFAPVFAPPDPYPDAP